MNTIPPPPPPRGFRRPIPAWLGLAALVIGIGLGYASGIGPSAPSNATSTSSSAIPTVSPSPTAETPTAPPPPIADSSAEYSSRCDYLLGPYSLVGEAEIENTGNIGIVVEVKGSWDILGSAPVTKIKRTKVEIGRTKAVQLNVRSNIDQILAHQSANADCRVKARIVDEFGAPEA